MKADRFAEYFRGIRRSRIVRIVQFALCVILGQLVGWLFLFAGASTPLVFLVGGQRELPYVLAALPMFGGLLGVALYWLVTSRRESDKYEKASLTGRRALKAPLRIAVAILLGFLMGVVNMLGVRLVEGGISTSYQCHYVVAFAGAGSVAGFVAGIAWAAGKIMFRRRSRQ
jgi:hypothetical protein